MKLEEVIVGILIVIVIGLTLLPEAEKVIHEPVTEIPFEAYPLKAWRDGRVVKIKYRVDQPNRTYEIVLGGEYEGGFGQISVLYNHI